MWRHSIFSWAYLRVAVKKCTFLQCSIGMQCNIFKVPVYFTFLGTLEIWVTTIENSPTKIVRVQRFFEWGIAHPIFTYDNFSKPKPIFLKVPFWSSLKGWKMICLNFCEQSIGIVVGFAFQLNSVGLLYIVHWWSASPV